MASINLSGVPTLIAPTSGKGAAAIAPKVRTRQFNNTNHGSVATLPGMGQGGKMPSAITYTINNATGGTLTYVFGEGANGLIAGAIGATWTQPTSVRGSTLAAVQDSFKANPVSIGLVNYEVTTVAQFAQNFRYVSGDIEQYSGKLINIDLARRNNQQISTLQTLNFSDSPYALDAFHCFTLDVLAGETVVMTFGLDAAAGR